MWSEHESEGEVSDTDRIYPCADCGTLRTKAEGGTTFTVCEECWDKHYKAEGPATKEPEQSPSLPPGSPSGVARDKEIFVAGMCAGNSIGADPDAMMDRETIEREWSAYKASLPQSPAPVKYGPNTYGSTEEEAPATPAAAPVEGERVTPWAFPKKDCDLCRGSGFYGDNGPGRRGNREFVRCECTTAPGSQGVEGRDHG